MLARHVQGVPRQLGLNRWSTLAYHKSEIAKYLASVRGPSSPPLEFVVHPRPTGEAARVLITEYDIPAANEPDSLAWFNGSDWQAGAGTSGAFPGAVHDVVVDAHGNAWMNSINPNAGRVAVKLDPETGQVTAFTVPNAVGGGAHLHRSGRHQPLARRAPQRPAAGRAKPRADRSGEWSVRGPLRLRREGAPGFQTHIAPTADGKVWTATQFGALHFDPETKTFRFFPDATLHDGFTYGIAADRHGNAWLAKYGADKIGFVDAKSGKASEIDLRPPWLDDEEDLLTEADREAYAAMGVGSSGGINMVPGRQAPRRLGYDPNADVVWVANNNGDAVGQHRREDPSAEVLSCTGATRPLSCRRGQRRQCVCGVAHRRRAPEAESRDGSVDDLPHAGDGL